MVLVAGVAVEKTAYHFDKEYSYRVPEAMESKIRPGCRVLVPFGAGGRNRQGVVISLGKGEREEKQKEIAFVLDPVPLLSEEMISLMRFMKEHLFCTLFEAAKAMLPTGINLKMIAFYTAQPDIPPELKNGLSEQEAAVLNHLLACGVPQEGPKLLAMFGLAADSPLLQKMVQKGVLRRTDDAVRNANDATVRMARLNASEERLEELRPALTKKQLDVVRLLSEVGSASVKEICYFTSVTPAVIKNLEKKELLLLYQNERYRDPFEEERRSPVRADIHLTQEQENAFFAMHQKYREGKGGAALLYGVTGSGKTQVFLRLIDEALKSGREVIVMVPEIALTPQTLSIFHRRYGAEVAVFHSGLSVGERMDEWKRVKRGEARIAVGTRSAVFAPFENLGLVIMDEEQEHTYKSEASPRYHARDVARFRCAHQKGLLVLASATPSVSSYTAALQGRYLFCTLKQRFGAAKLPKVLTVDMKEQAAKGVTGAISAPLLEALRENLEKGRQSILLMNRRGFHTFAACSGCGAVITCPNCSISMTYHAANGRMMCHYCGHSMPLPRSCPTCGEGEIRYAGAGTQRVEQEIEALLPNARILRMDMDTTMARFAHETKLGEFKKGAYDIMLGTQMVAKGLDFPNVTLVGVINADQSLYSDDYTSGERTFSLLTQVVGRAGRGSEAGLAVIQTITPEHPILQYSAAQDYDSFYQNEIALRKLMIYPPYCDLLAAGFVGTREMIVQKAAFAFFDLLKEKNMGNYKEEKLIVLGPLPAKVSRVSNKFRYRLAVKCKNTKRIRQMFSELLTEMAGKKEFKNITIYIDTNPEDLF